MRFTSAQWLDAGKTTIAALGDDGEIHFVPADAGNPDYRAGEAIGIADPPAATLEQKLAAIQARRDQAILAFSFAGHPVPLTDKTQQDIGNAVQALGRQPAGTTVAWEIADGVYVDMDLAAVQAFGDAAFAHVQACFANSKALTALLDAATAYDLESGWPG